MESFERKQVLFFTPEAALEKSCGRLVEQVPDNARAERVAESKE